MKEQSHSTPEAPVYATEKREVVSIQVDLNHPLLQLKWALPWDTIQEAMIKRWKAAGKNVDGSKCGCSLDVLLWVPLVVLMIVKNLDPREMEAYLSENVVARMFIGKTEQLSPQIRDHSRIGRNYGALGKEGIKELTKLILLEAKQFGFADPTILSADTTAQELPIGYPNEPGILRGLAQRCLRAFAGLKKKGEQGLDYAVEKAKTVLKSVKEHHLFAKGKEAKTEILTRLVQETTELMEQTTQVIENVKGRSDRVKQGAIEKLESMKEVATKLIPQILYWMKTGLVAKGKILHAGIPKALAIVRKKAGKKTEFGLPYLINRIGGGYLFAELLMSCPDESKMPLQSLVCYREIFGKNATPKRVVYDRGGWCQTTVKKLKEQGIEQIGILPKGKAPWLVAEEIQKQVMSERGKTEGSIGTIKSKKYGFNKPLERNLQSLQMAGHRSVLSFNLNKLMKDIVKSNQMVQV